MVSNSAVDQLRFTPLTVRNFAERVAPLCVIVFGMALAYTTKVQVQTPEARSATPPNRTGIALRLDLFRIILTCFSLLKFINLDQ